VSVLSSESNAATTAPNADPTPLTTLPGEPVSTNLMRLACVAAYLIPGTGHLLLGRWKRGLLCGGSIIAMFVLGVAMHGHLYFPNPSDKVSFAFTFANAGVGLPYFICYLLHLALNVGLGFGVAQANAITFEYGNTFLWSAGLLNYLVILDAYDIAIGRKR
jgi:hypothetical protein